MRILDPLILCFIAFITYSNATELLTELNNSKADFTAKTMPLRLKNLRILPILLILSHSYFFARCTTEARVSKRTRFLLSLGLANLQLEVL